MIGTRLLEIVSSSQIIQDHTEIEDHFWKQREKNILRVRNSKQLINYGMCRFVSLYRSTRMINVKDNGQLSNSNVYTVEDIYYLFFRNRGKPSHQKKNQPPE